MTPEILTMLGMTATILIASWTMNRSLRTDLRADLHRFEDKVDARFEAMDTKIDARFEAMDTKIDARFEAMDTKIDARFEAMDTKIDALREDQHTLNARMSGLEGLLQGLKEAIVARSVA